MENPLIALLARLLRESWVAAGAAHVPLPWEELPDHRKALYFEERASGLTP